MPHFFRWFIGWRQWKTRQHQSFWYSNFKFLSKANSKKHFLRLFVSCCCYLSKWAPYNNLAASTLCKFAKYGSSAAVNLCPTMLILFLSLLKRLPMTIVVQQIKPTENNICPVAQESWPCCFCKLHNFCSTTYALSWNLEPSKRNDKMLSILRMTLLQIFVSVSTILSWQKDESQQEGVWIFHAS